MGKLKNSMLEYQQAQFDQMFGALDTIKPNIDRKADLFIEQWADQFSPYQLDILADEFGWTMDQRERAISLYEKACAI